MRKRSIFMVGVVMLGIFMPVVMFAGDERVLLFEYTGDRLPSADGWTIKNYPKYESIGAQIEDGNLHFTDDSTDGGSAIHYTREWGTTPETINVAEFEVKIISVAGEGDTPPGLLGIYIGTSDGVAHMVYTLYPDRILSSYLDGGGNFVLGETYKFDTTRQFNTYATMIENGMARLYLNGKLVLKQRAGAGICNVQGVEFGAGSSRAIGEAEFKAIRAYQQPKGSLPDTW